MFLLAFSFSTVTEMIKEVASSSCENGGTDIYSDSNLSDLEWANDVMVLSEDPGQ